MIINSNSSPKNITLLIIGFYIFSTTSWYLISGGNPVLILYENGFDGFLQAIIKSESRDRILQLIVSIDENFFRIALGFLIFIFIFFLFIKSNKIIFSNSFYDFFKADEFKSTNFSKNIYIAIALASALGLFLELSIIRIHSSYFQL